MSREQFEAWVMTEICISKSTLEGLRTEDGYRNSTLSGTNYNRMWSCWQAASKASEQQLAAVVAENAGLKKFCKNAAFDADYEAELCMEQGGFTDALDEIKTPTTDAFLDEVRAQGVDALNIQFKKCSGMLYADSVIETAAEFAAKLRQGAKS